MKADMSVNIQLTYKTAFYYFTNFRVEYALDAKWPAMLLKILVNFLFFCFEKGDFSTTLYTYRLSTSSIHKINLGLIQLTN